MFDRQRNQSDHEKAWRWVHPALKEFFTNALVSYQQTQGNQNFIGAQAAAYDRQMLPINEWKGPGEVVMFQLQNTPPQVYVQQVVKPTGIAGIATGQVWNGPLVDSTGNGKIV